MPGRPEWDRADTPVPSERAGPLGYREVQTASGGI